MSIEHFKARIESKNRDILHYKRLITNDQDKIKRLKERLKKENESAKAHLRYAKDTASKSRIRLQRDKATHSIKSDVEGIKSDIEKCRKKIDSIREDIRGYKDQITKLKKRK